MISDVKDIFVCGNSSEEAKARAVYVCERKRISTEAIQPLTMQEC